MTKGKPEGVIVMDCDSERPGAPGIAPARNVAAHRPALKRKAERAKRRVQNEVSTF